MISLKNRILISFALSLCIFLIIFAVSLFFGFNLSLKDWNKANEEEYIKQITNTLEKYYKNNNYSDSEEISELLTPYLKENMETIVFDKKRIIIFSHNSDKSAGEKVFTNRFMDRLGLWPENEFHPPVNNIPPPMITGREDMEHRIPQPPFPDEMNDIHNMKSMNSRHTGMMNIKKYLEYPEPGQPYIRPVMADRQIKAFVKVKSLKLKFYSRANKRFINSIIITLITGTLSALAIALTSSYIISRQLTKDAASLAGGINSLAGGNRNVIFPNKGSKEILSISESASVLQKELIQDENRRKQWAQDIAHDLRTPVTAVKAQIEAVLDGVFTADENRMKKVLKELKRLENLVEDMNSLSKIESSANNIYFSDINSSDIEGILKERFEILAEEKNIDLRIKSEDFYIRCDLHLLIRALSNLCQNSINYSEEGSAVDVSITKKDSKAVFSFENPGHIVETEIDKIFDRLYRGETGRTSEGSGLGLTIAAAVVKQHNGEIKAENIAEKVHFSIQLPLEQKG